MNDRDVLARVIDSQCFSDEAQEMIDTGSPGNWVNRQKRAYKKVDEILEYILAVVEAANPPLATPMGSVCDDCDGLGHTPSTVSTWVVTCRSCGGSGEGR